MYSTRSNASPLKPMDFFAPPLIPKVDQYRPEPKTLGFGTLPSPKPMPVGISDQIYGLPIGTNGNYERQYSTADELLGREPILEPPPRPAGMHSAWQEGPDPSYMPSRGRGQVPAGYDKEAWLEQGLLVPIEEVQRQQQELLRQKQEGANRTAAMQGAPMGADDGSLVNLDDFQVPQRQPFMPDPNDPIARFGQPPVPAPGNPYINGGQMPYPGGMSGPHMQGRMQNILDEMLTRQQYGRQYNDMQLQRDQYDDGWDRARADILNPLMGGLMGGRGMAAMTADSNNRRNQIMDRRQLRRQSMTDQWGQTKDLISMIAANDPQTIKNQNMLAKTQNDYMQKIINQQNANTNQFSSQSNAQYKSRMATVAESKAATAASNLQRLISEGADRSQRGWAMIESNRSKWESSLEMRGMELEQRKAQAAASNDIRMMALIQKDEADLAKEQIAYDKMSADLESKAAEVDKNGAPKRSAEFVDKYGTKAAPGKEPAPQQNQAADIINALGGFFQRVAGGNQQSGTTAPAPKPVPGKQPTKPAAQSAGSKPITPDVVRMLKAKFPNDMKAAMAEARRLGYRID